MSSPPADLRLSDLTAALSGNPMGHTIYHHTSVASTMPLAHALAPTAPSGTVILADEQTQGRGRLARRWDAPPGLGLLLSVLVKPPHLPQMPAQLPMIAGLAVANALERAWPATRGHVWLKWPNDVLLDTGKVCGTLIESALTGSEMSHAVLGIGINIHQRAEDLPPVPDHRPQPTSLALFGERIGSSHPSRADLLHVLCVALGDLLGPDAPAAVDLHRRWQGRLITLGQAVTVWPRAAESAAGGEPFSGMAVSTTLTGELVVRAPTGAERTFAAGDVTTGATTG
jgi:BirA family biotin operon repressor/biotin-[acetyl-CoA-carboxylase] ligase